MLAPSPSLLCHAARVTLVACSLLWALLGLELSATPIDSTDSSQWAQVHSGGAGLSFDADGFNFLQLDPAGGSASINWTQGKLPVNRNWTVEAVTHIEPLGDITVIQYTNLSLTIVSTKNRKVSWPMTVSRRYMINSLPYAPTKDGIVTCGESTVAANRKSIVDLSGTEYLLRIRYTAATHVMDYYLGDLASEPELIFSLDVGPRLTELGMGDTDTFDLSLVAATWQRASVAGQAAFKSLNIQGVLAGPEIVTQPLSQWISKGAAATLSVAALENASAGVRSYQWYEGPSGDRSRPVSGAIGATLTTPFLWASTSYWALVSDRGGSAESFTADVTVDGRLSTDDFSVPARWPLSLGSASNGSFAPGLGRLSYLAGSVADSAALSLWTAANLPSDKNWSAQVEVHLDSFALNTPGQFATLGLGASFARLSPVNTRWAFEYERGNRTEPAGYSCHDGSVYVRNVQAPNFSLGGLSSSDATLRIDYSAASRSFTYLIDHGGPGDGVAWVALAQVSAQAGIDAAGIAHGDSFSLFLKGASNKVLLGEGGARFSNFRVYQEGVSVAAPVITQHPASTTIGSGNTVILTVAGIAPEARIQWFRGTSPDVSEPIEGATYDEFFSPVLTATTSYWVQISNAGGTVNSQTAVITVDPKVFSGQYFGSFADGDGDWAIHVRPDNTGVFLAYLKRLSKAVTAELQVVADGSFGLKGGAAGVAGPVGAFSLTGQISLARAVSLSLSGHTPVPLAGTGFLELSSNDLQRFAGYFTATALGADQGQARLITGGNGTAFLLLISESGAENHIGTQASGSLHFTLPEGSWIHSVIERDSGVFRLTRNSPGVAVRFAGISDAKAAWSRLTNLSINTRVTPDENVTAGFILHGGSNKSLLIRGVGPSLSALKIPGLVWLPNPRLSLYSMSAQAVLSDNDDWGSAHSNAPVFEANAHHTGFPLSEGAKDSALLATVDDSKGGYTAQVDSLEGGSGTAIVELYDIAVEASARLTNLSANSRVTADKTLTAGFVITGNVPKTVLIRAVGPSLKNYGVKSGYLPNPKLTVYDTTDSGNVVVVKSNDDWGTTEGNASLASATLRSGAGLVLEEGSKDAAVVVTLSPGLYTAEMGSADGGSGSALVEVYEVE